MKQYPPTCGWYWGGAINKSVCLLWYTVCRQLMAASLLAACYHETRRVVAEKRHLAWVRGDQQLTKDLIKSRIRRVQRKCGFLSSGSLCFFQLFPWDSAWRYILEVDWEGRLRVLVRNLRTTKVVCRVNVSGSCGASSPGLSWIKARGMSFTFFSMQDIARIRRKVKTTFSLFLVEASLPWHWVNSIVHKQTRGMSFTFISARISNKIQLQYHSYQYWNYTKVQKVSITSEALTLRCGLS